MNNKRVLTQVELARKALDENRHDPGVALEFVKNLPEIKEFGLDDLLWSLKQDSYCSYRDVKGFLDDIVSYALDDGFDDAIVGSLP